MLSADGNSIPGKYLSLYLVWRSFSKCPGEWPQRVTWLRPSCNSRANAVPHAPAPSTETFIPGSVQRWLPRVEQLMKCLAASQDTFLDSAPDFLSWIRFSVPLRSLWMFGLCL